MSDGRFVLRLKKDVWNKQIGIQCDSENDKTEKPSLNRKRSIPQNVPTSDNCGPHLKRNSRRNSFSTDNVGSSYLEKWLFTEKVLTNFQSVLSLIPLEIMSSSVQYTEEESSLSAIGVLTYGRLLKHIADLHVESIQRLMRPVLQKLMQHPRNVNIFNQPVDHVGLGIPDYLVKIPIPMDLGTVKSRLLRGEYSNVETCATDITLVFQNAITYNPPTHVVHQIALIMKEEFEAEMELVRERCSKEVCEYLFLISRPYKQTCLFSFLAHTHSHTRSLLPYVLLYLYLI